MAMPYALLRAGFPYVKTLGMRRVTDAPVDVAVGSDDNVYVLGRLAGSSPIRKLTWDDDFLGPVGAPEAAFEWPVAIAMDAAGQHLRVRRGGPSHNRHHERRQARWGRGASAEKGKGELNGPSGIALDRDGNLYVSDTLNHRVQRFTKEGRFHLGLGQLRHGGRRVQHAVGRGRRPGGRRVRRRLAQRPRPEVRLGGAFHPRARRSRRGRRPVQPARGHRRGRGRRRLRGRPG